MSITAGGAQAVEIVKIDFFDKQKAAVRPPRMRVDHYARFRLASTNSTAHIISNAGHIMAPSPVSGTAA